MESAAGADSGRAPGRRGIGGITHALPTATPPGSYALRKRNGPPPLSVPRQHSGARRPGSFPDAPMMLPPRTGRGITARLYFWGMPQQKPENQAAADAIIDSELDATKLIDEAAANTTDIALALSNLARRLVALRLSGRITAAGASQMLREAWRNLHLAAYARVVGKVKDTVEANHEREQEVFKDVDLESLDIIRNSDIKKRQELLGG